MPPGPGTGSTTVSCPNIADTDENPRASPPARIRCLLPAPLPPMGITREAREHGFQEISNILIPKSLLLIQKYRFRGMQETLASGIYTDVSLQMARGRHLFARRVLADGIDPSKLKRTLGKHAFAVVAREWLIHHRSKIGREIG